jgi:L-ascorbate metabolism protein UlaG (beta-lactamase superfamily)
MSRRVVAPEDLLVGMLFSTHNHTDHLDPETLRPLLHSNKGAHLFVSAANVEEAYRRAQVGFGVIGLTEDVEHSRYDGFFTIRVVPAAHEVIERDEQGVLKCVGFVVTLGPWTIYHSGDTLVYDGMVERLRPFNVDVAILPINGKVGNMGGADAARLAKEIGARIVIPCHYDMFEFNTADPADEFIPECRRLGQPYRVLQLGERFSSTEIPA